MMRHVKKIWRFQSLNTLFFRAICVLVLILCPACTGQLGIRYGETICDTQHPCHSGFICVDGFCVVDPSTGDTDSQQPGDGHDIDLGEWENPPGDLSHFGDTQSCRVDNQCLESERCIRGNCLLDPCSVYDIGCQDNEFCQVKCRPTDDSCQNVNCPVEEHCVLGECRSLCKENLCPRCKVGASNPYCHTGTELCVGNTICLDGRCVNSVVTTCDERFCANGDICYLACLSQSACIPNPCNSGWVCVATDETPEGFTCVETICAGINCAPGLRCNSEGKCVDPCASELCINGGKAGCADNEICCPQGKQCCVLPYVCNQITGECEPPTAFCDPECEDDEICRPECDNSGQCFDTKCFCGSLDDPTNQILCNETTECCVNMACENPCIDSPCITNSEEKFGCKAACNETEGYVCVDLCEENQVVCLPPNTCNPQTGQCDCGGTNCLPNLECCVNNTCIAPCTVPDACPRAGDTSNLTRCKVDCSESTHYICLDPCDDIQCNSIQNPECKQVGDTAVCYCPHDPGQAVCTSSECCLTSSGCEEPCTGSLSCPKTSDPPNYTNCTVDCNHTDGYACDNPCAGQCSSARNPDCRPVGTSSYECYCDDDPSDAICASDECCLSSTGCEKPCTGSLTCPKNGEPATYTRCTLDCNSSDGYTCADPCAGRCNGDRNPDCRPIGASSYECYCDDDPSDTVCASDECCLSSTGCEKPCTGSLTCPKNGEPATYTRCRLDCSNSDGYTCSDPCASASCNQPNPDCQVSGSDALCYCDDDPSDSVCTSSDCCLTSGCFTPCASPSDCPKSGDPSTYNSCTRDCSNADGFTCSDLCASNSCNQPNPDCRSDGTSRECYCDNDPSDNICSSNDCCLASGCFTPCASPSDCPKSGDPSTHTTCNRDCSDPDGYTCSNLCSGHNCNQPNPDCRSDGSNTECYCDADSSDSICQGSMCCLGSGCVDPCASQPCTSGECVKNCAMPSGYECIDHCQVSPPDCYQPNPDCYPFTEDTCRCGTDYLECQTNEHCCFDSQLRSECEDTWCCIDTCTDDSDCAFDESCDLCNGCYLTNPG